MAPAQRKGKHEDHPDAPHPRGSAWLPALVPFNKEGPASLWGPGAGGLGTWILLRESGSCLVPSEN